MHQHCLDVHLDFLIPDGIGFSWNDWIKPFAHIDGAEDRPRFLAYLIALVDYRLRFIAYDRFVMFPTFSIGWILTLGVGPWLLFRTARNLGLSVEGAMTALILYAASTGFLFDFCMMLFPAKALTNVVFIASMYLVSRLQMERKEDELLCEIRSPLKAVLFFVIFAGLFLDEGPLFLFVALPVLFRELFILPSFKTSDIQRMIKNGLWFLSPFLVFLFLVVFIVPVITQHYFSYRFDYLGTLLAAKKEQMEIGKTFFGRDGEGFGPASLFDNFMTLFGTSLVPWQISPYILHKPTAGVVSSQAHNAAQISILFLAFAGMAMMMRKSSGENKTRLKRFAAVTALYILFMSAIIGRHIMFITGYYYGCTFGLFFAMLAAFGLEELQRSGRRFVLLSVALVSLIAVIQLDNFALINRSWVYFHTEVWTKNGFKHLFPIADEKLVTRGELKEIWTAWKEKRIVPYLREHPASSGAVFLLVELRHRDKISHPS